jgi:DNA-binding LacI/PurR family transcriptional regulator
VSGPTVSNVLNGSGRVGEAAKARVLEAVAALGYQPHHSARSLRSRRTRQIGYVLPPVQLFPSNYIMQQFLQALAVASGRRGNSMVLVVQDQDPCGEMRRLVASRSVDAFVLSEMQPDDPRVALLAEAGMPFACFGRTGPGQPQYWVDIDNHAAVITAVEHVLARGFSRVAFAGYQSGHWDDERADGFRAGLARHGIPVGEADVLLVDDAGARRKIRSLLTGTHRGGRAGERPDAIVTGSDRLAAHIYEVAAELRLRIGRDLGVTGFDGSMAAGLLHPRLTSVTIPVDDIARRLVARVLRQVDHGPDQSPGEVVEAPLRLGESTGGKQRSSQAPDDRSVPEENDNALVWRRLQGA